MELTVVIRPEIMDSCPLDLILIPALMHRQMEIQALREEIAAL